MELVFVKPGSPLIEDARRLFTQYEAELGIDLCFQGFEEELASLPGKYTLPSGALVLAIEGGAAVGCGAFRPLEGTTCELKRFFVQPAARRGGLAAKMLSKLLNQARKSGYTTVVLDTLERLSPALAFYEKHGFDRIDPYYENPEPDVVFMGRSIRPEAPDLLQPFLDIDGRLTKLPEGKGAVTVFDTWLETVAPHFESGREYSEREVNEVLRGLHTFNDPATIRRALVDRQDLQRTADGTRYWRP